MPPGRSALARARERVEAAWRGGRDRMLRALAREHEAVASIHGEIADAVRERVAREVGPRPRGGRAAAVERVRRAVEGEFAARLDERREAIVRAHAEAGVASRDAAHRAVYGEDPPVRVEADEARARRWSTEALERRPFAIDGVTLSERLHETGSAAARGVAAAVNSGLRAGESVREIGARILAAEDPHVLLPRVVADLRRAVANPDTAAMRAELRRGGFLARSTAARRLAGGEGTRALYNALADAALRGERAGVDTALRWWIQDRAVHDAMRIARTEAARAAASEVVRSTEDDPDVVGYRWVLAASHPELDVCDQFAEQDLHGLGEGGYPREALPVLPAHPHCLCALQPIFVDEVRRGARPLDRSPGAYLERVGREDPARLRTMVGPTRARLVLAGNASRVVGPRGEHRPVWAALGLARPGPAAMERVRLSAAGPWGSREGLPALVAADRARDREAERVRRAPPPDVEPILPPPPPPPPRVEPAPAPAEPARVAAEPAGRTIANRSTEGVYPASASTALPSDGNPGPEDAIARALVGATFVRDLGPMGGGGIFGARRTRVLGNDGAHYEVVWKTDAAESREPDGRTGIRGGTLRLRERAAFMLDRLLGGRGVVPPTVELHLEGELGSAQVIVPGVRDSSEATERVIGTETFRDAASRLLLLDLVSANDDRHRYNWLLADGRPVAIDNGLTFPDRSGATPNRFFTVAVNADYPVRTAHEHIERATALASSLDARAVARTLAEAGLNADEVASAVRRLLVLQRHPDAVRAYVTATPSIYQSIGGLSVTLSEFIRRPMDVLRTDHDAADAIDQAVDDAMEDAPLDVAPRDGGPDPRPGPRRRGRR